MRRQLIPALLCVVVFTVLCGLVYPLVTTGVGRVAFAYRSEGSLIRRQGVVVGSELIGQNFSDPAYFWPRPSAAGVTGYDGSASGGTNLGPTNPDFLATVADRVAAYRTANNLAADQLVPVDAVTSSGSGLDPDISVANARLQAARVGRTRGMSTEQVEAMIDRFTGEPTLGFIGERTVNVLQLNLALDAPS